MRQILDKKTWIELRKELKKSNEYNKTWSITIDLFRQRIEDFYLKPIDKILLLDNKGEGFSILTLQCVLIEMLAAFKKGKIHNRYKNKNGLKYEYKDSSSCFIDFLNSENIFENNFFRLNKNNDIEKNSPFSAKDFYSKVRCGLLHEGRTKKEWLITTSNKNGFSNDIFIIENNDKTKSINRNILQKKLEFYFKNVYIEQLKENNIEGAKMRRFFGRKLDHLHDIKRDVNFDWWKDK